MEHATPTRVSAFDPDAYLRELNKPSVSVDMLQAARNQVQTKVDETNASLKRNVYKNYALFIDTAKEISLLKNEMYTLSHLLTEEQQLLSNLTDISISGDKTHGLTLNEKREVAAKFRTINEEPSPVKTIPKSQSVQVISPSVTMASKELTAILDKIEGCSGMLETRNRILLNHGELTELDANDYSKIPNQGRTLVVLLNDCLILAQAFPFPSRMGKRFKFTSLYELDNVAVVNVKDMSVKNAFKILMFPSTKVYEVETIESKKRWIESFEMAKKQRRASLSLQRRDSLLYLSTNLSMDGLNSARDGTGTKSMMSPVDHRPGYTFEDVAELLEDNSESESEALPQWLQEVPEDMDVMMAQRDFEKAVELVHRVNDHLVLYPKCYDGFMQNDLKLRTNHKIQELVEFIANELQTTPDRSLQSGPRSARRAVQLLLRLGKSSMAVKLFLNQRSALLKFSLKQQITEGSGTVQYSKRICGVFGNNVIESCREFDKAFRTSTMEGRDRDSSFSSLDGERDSMNSNNDRTASSSYPVAYPLAALVGWTRSELKNFVNETFSKAVFPSTNSSSVIAECVAILRNHVNRIRTDLRLDMLFVLDTLLKADIDKLIKENSEKIIKDIKAWKKDEKWTPSDLGSKTALNKFCEDLKRAGVFTISTFVFDDTKVSLSNSTANFSRDFLSLVHDLLKLSNGFNNQIILDAVESTFKQMMSFVEMSLRNDQFKDQRTFIRRNAMFLLDTILSLAEQRFNDKMINCKELDRLRTDFEFLKSEEVRKRSPSKTTISIGSEGKTSTSVTYL